MTILIEREYFHIIIVRRKAWKEKKIYARQNLEWRDLWRNTFQSVVPGYHMNKKHWNSITLDGTVPEADVKRMIAESYDITKC